MKRGQPTVLEIVVVIAAVAVLAVLLLPALTPYHHHRDYRRIRDAGQVRSIHQAMVVWAAQHYSAADGSGPEAPAPPR